MKMLQPKRRTWSFLEPIALDRMVSRPWRIVIYLTLGFLVLRLLTGCATVEQWTDDHPQAIVVAEGAIIVVGALAVAKGVEKSGRTVVVTQPPPK